jgi:hypothetical protein
MNNAPSVSYPVARPHVAWLVVAGLWLAGAVTTLAWTVAADAPGWRQAAAAFAVVAGGLHAILSWKRCATGDLHWDGEGWRAPGASAGGSLQVALDLQRLLLVHWVGPGGSRWLWLERQRCPQRWRDLLRAVYSPAGPMALPADQPPPATP